mmetsp:Transcript_8517/g.19652  ORF Transcript_8517/g.19652 Transcript_8517/m.19652 type:complete len:231 (+) Transcript_8517:366-1058(+)
MLPLNAQHLLQGVCNLVVSQVAAQLVVNALEALRGAAELTDRQIGRQMESHRPLQRGLLGKAKQRLANPSPLHAQKLLPSGLFLLHGKRRSAQGAATFGTQPSEASVLALLRQPFVSQTLQSRWTLGWVHLQHAAYQGSCSGRHSSSLHPSSQVAIHVCPGLLVVYGTIRASTSVGDIVGHLACEKLMCYDSQAENVAPIIEAAPSCQHAVNHLGSHGLWSSGWHRPGFA